MKKIIILALVIMASAITVNAASKKDKQNKKAKQMTEVFEMEEPTPVVLNNAQDSVSYATGMAATRGLLAYLQQQFGFDEMFLDDFKKGFEEALAQGTDPKYVAHNAGIIISQQMQKQILPQASSQFEGTPLAINPDMFAKGFIAGAMKDESLFAPSDAEKYQRTKAEEMKEVQKQNAIAENTKWLEENAKKEGVVVLPSGLQYKVLVQGTGAVAEKDDNVTVKYEGKMIDGTVFDSSYTRTPDTTSFKPTQVIKGWTEALCMMPEGSKWELYIPQELAYGERPAGKIKPYSTLIFTVEIVKVEK